MQTVEQTLVPSVDLVGVLTGLKLLMHAVVPMVLGLPLLVEGDAAARRGRAETTLEGPVCLSDFLQAFLMLILGARRVKTQI